MFEKLAKDLFLDNKLKLIIMDWLVICTKPKWEIKVAAQLTNNNITCYCPTIMKERKWSDRIKKINTPLFTNYVFVQINPKDRNLVFISPGVVRYLCWNNEYAIVKNNEIETIKKWLNEAKEIKNDKEKFKIGTTVKINKHQLFSNQTGILKEIKNNEYIIVLEKLGSLLHLSKEEEISKYENPI